MEKELENKESIFSALKKLFSNDVIVRNIGGKKLKLIDTDSTQRGTDRNSLKDRFNRLRTSTYNLHNRDMAMSYQSARLELFRDYDTMDMDPILSSALDIYSEECLTKSELGKVLTVSSDDDNIKQILENLFYDILNVEFNLWSWTRNLVKYGDFFLLMEISPEYGVYNVHPLSAYEVTRVEGTDEKNRSYVKFQHDGSHGGQQYENFEMAHFRLLSDSNFLPYGKSMLEGARRVWKQLCLHENSEVWTLNGSKKIKDIEIGETVYSFDPVTGKSIITKVKNKAYTGNRNVYKISTCHRDILATVEHPILTTTGYKNVGDLTVSDYLILPTTDNVGTYYPTLTLEMSSKIDNRLKVISEEVLKDNFPEFVRFFGFMLGDGWLDKSNNTVCFCLGDRLDKSNKYIKLIEKLGVNYRLTNGTENDSSCIVNSKYLYDLFIQLGFVTGSHNKIVPTWVHSLNNTHMIEFVYGFADADGCDRDENTHQISSVNESLIDGLRLIAMKSGLSVTRKWSSTGKGYAGSCVMYYFTVKMKSRDFIMEKNYHIERIRHISDDGKVDVYDIEVENDIHNFMVDGLIVHNCLMEDAMLIHRIMRAPEKRIFKIDVGNIPPSEVDSHMEKLISRMKKVPYVDERTGDYNLKFNLMNMVEDFYLPVRGGDSGTSIDTLGGMEFTGTEDIEYLRNKLMSALKIPKAFLGYDETLSGKSTLAQEDVRFSKTINRIQSILVSELNKIAIVHLRVQGFEDASLVNFKLELTNPSSILEQEKISIWGDKMNLSKDMIESEMFSTDFIYKQLFNLSESQIEEIRLGVVSDKKTKYRLTQITESGNDPAKSNQSVDSEGSTSDMGDTGDMGGGDMGGGDMSGGDIGGDMGSETLPDMGAEEPERLQEYRKESDRKGESDQSEKSKDFLFGENPLGKPEKTGSKSENPLRDKVRGGLNGVPSLRETEKTGLESIFSKADLQKMKEKLTKVQKKEVITENISIMDEKNIMSD